MYRFLNEPIKYTFVVGEKVKHVNDADNSIIMDTLYVVDFVDAPYYLIKKVGELETMFWAFANNLRSVAKPQKRTRG